MKKILVPTDFSAIAENAVDFAAKVALKAKCDLIIFHSEDPDVEEDGKKLLVAAESIKNKYQGLKVEVKLTDKYFNALTIEDLFGSKNLELVVIGSGGDEASFEKRLFGTNSSEIAEELNCPVLVVPGIATIQKINKIAFASDLNFLETELPRLVNFAKTFSAEILVFHVEPVFPDLGDITKRNIRKEIELIAQKLAYPNISYYTEQTSYDNQTHRGIDQFVKSHKPDLLVLFHDKREGFDKYISLTQTDKVVTELPAPTLVFAKGK